MKVHTRFILLMLCGLLAEIFLFPLLFAQNQNRVELYDVQWSPFPDVITAISDDKLFFLSPTLNVVDSWRIVQDLSRKNISYYAWSPDGLRIALMLHDIDSPSGFAFELWNATTKEKLTEISGVLPQILEWSANGQYVVFNKFISRLDNDMWFLNGSDGSITYQWELYKEVLEWSPAGSQVALRGNGLEFWDVSVFPPVFIGRLPQIYDMAYNQSGSQIVFTTLAEPKLIRMVDVETLQEVRTIMAPHDIVDLSWGQHPLTTSTGSFYEVWSAERGEIIISGRVEKLLFDSSSEPSWNPSGTAYVVNDEKLGITVYDGQTGEVLANLSPDAPLIPAG